MKILYERCNWLLFSIKHEVYIWSFNYFEKVDHKNEITFKLTKKILVNIGHIFGNNIMILSCSRHPLKSVQIIWLSVGNTIKSESFNPSLSFFLYWFCKHWNSCRVDGIQFFRCYCPHALWCSYLYFLYH